MKKPKTNPLQLLCKVAVCAIILSGCSKNDPSESSLEGNVKEQTTAVSSSCTTGCWIGVTNQANKELEYYSWFSEDWSVGGTARTWNWKPTAARGYNTTTEVPKWGTPNDFKMRDVPAWGNNYIAAIGNGGLITIFSYATGNEKWSAVAGGSAVDNIHGVELLPTGNVAVAASKGGWVRLYASSGTGTSYSSYALPDAHAVLWDPANNCLWAFGRKKLAKLTVGTASSPDLTQVGAWNLPSDDYGHSISAKYGNTNELYVASSNHVWVFNKTSGVFSFAPGTIANKNGVKAISNQPDGVVVLTRPDIYKSPVPSQPSTVNTGWTTTYVDYYNGTTGAYIRSGHRNGAAYYKGFVNNTNYQ